MNEKYRPNYENTEEVNRELKRLIDSATARPTAQTMSRGGRAGGHLARAFVLLALTGALFYPRQFVRPKPARARDVPPRGLMADGVVALTPNQWRSVTVEPVSWNVISDCRPGRRPDRRVDRQPDCRPDGRKSLVVPDSAVIALDAKPLVFVEEAPGRFRRRQVEPGRGLGGRMVIERGLEEGERVVTHGAILLSALTHESVQHRLENPSWKN